MLAIFTRHRGPFQFQVCRTKPATSVAKCRFTTELLAGDVDAEDVEAEAHALLNDPRDTIISVSVWTIQQRHTDPYHIYTFNKRNTHDRTDPAVAEVVERV